MYQVIKMYGNWEAWWFLEGWREDIVEEQEFDNFEEAFETYQELWQTCRDDYASHKSQANFLASFWDSEDQKWCEECVDYLQNYHSLLLLKDGKVLAPSYHLTEFESANDTPKIPSECAFSLEKSSIRVPVGEEV